MVNAFLEPAVERAAKQRRAAAFVMQIIMTAAAAAAAAIATHTLDHWLQECLATTSKRLQVLEEADPSLSILVNDPQGVILFALKTLQ